MQTFGVDISPEHHPRHLTILDVPTWVAHKPIKFSDKIKLMTILSLTKSSFCSDVSFSKNTSVASGSSRNLAVLLLYYVAHFSAPVESTFHL